MKKLGLFAAGVLFGTAGIKLLSKQQCNQRLYVPRHPGVFHCLPPNLIFTICIFIIPSPILARKRKNLLAEGSFKSL